MASNLLIIDETFSASMTTTINIARFIWDVAGDFFPAVSFTYYVCKTLETPPEGGVKIWDDRIYNKDVVAYALEAEEVIFICIRD